MTLLERLHTAAEPYLTGAWRYPSSATVGRRVAYPWPRPVRGPAVADHADDRAIDCSTLSASILMHLYPDAGWTQADYAALQVFDPKRPGSPIDAVVRAGVGHEAEPGWESLWLVQGWRRLPGDARGASGHAFLVWDRGTGVLDVLESTSRKLEGPRWRTSSWAALRAEYGAALYIARLRE